MYALIIEPGRGGVRGEKVGERNENSLEVRREGERHTPDALVVDLTIPHLGGGFEGIVESETSVLTVSQSDEDRIGILEFLEAIVLGGCPIVVFPSLSEGGGESFHLSEVELESFALP